MYTPSKPHLRDAKAGAHLPRRRVNHRLKPPLRKREVPVIRVIDAQLELIAVRPLVVVAPGERRVRPRRRACQIMPAASPNAL